MQRLLIEQWALKVSPRGLAFSKASLHCWTACKSNQSMKWIAESQKQGKHVQPSARCRRLKNIRGSSCAGLRRLSILCIVSLLVLALQSIRTDMDRLDWDLRCSLCCASRSKISLPCPQPLQIFLVLHCEDTELAAHANRILRLSLMLILLCACSMQVNFAYKVQPVVSLSAL